MYDIWKEDLEMPTVKELVENAAKEEQKQKSKINYKKKIEAFDKKNNSIANTEAYLPSTAYADTRDGTSANAFGSA